MWRGGLQPGLVASSRQVAGLDRRRDRTAMAARRQGVVLLRRQRPHGRGSENRRHILRSRYPEASVRRLRSRQRQKPLSGYRDLKLVVEYHERQRFEAVPFFDRMIVSSGITRGEQRRKYDQLRRDVLPMHSITLIEISYQEFEHDGRKRLLRVPSDLPVLQKRLSGVATADIPPQLA